MEYSISCPFCGNKENIHIYDVIRPKDEAVAKIMNAHLTFFKCSNCHKLSPIINNFIYLDEEKKFVILHKNNDEEFVDLSGFEKENYLIRIVSNIYEMREKIILFNRTLNDKVVELMKVLYKYEIEEDVKIDWVERIYIEEDNNYNIKISAILAGGTKRSYNFNEEIYKRISEIYNDAFKWNENEIIVDYKWAIDKINKGES